MFRKGECCINIDLHVASTMTSYEIKGAACSVYYENHCLPTMYYGNVVVVYGSYTLELNCHTPRASCIHGYKLFDVIVQATYTKASSWCTLEVRV